MKKITTPCGQHAPRTAFLLLVGLLAASVADAGAYVPPYLQLRSIYIIHTSCAPVCKRTSMRPSACFSKCKCHCAAHVGTTNMACVQRVTQPLQAPHPVTAADLHVCACAACWPANLTVATVCASNWSSRCLSYNVQNWTTGLGTPMAQKFLPLPMRPVNQERASCWLHCFRTTGCGAVAYYRRGDSFRGGVRRSQCLLQQGTGAVASDSNHDLLTFCPGMPPLPAIMNLTA